MTNWNWNLKSKKYSNPYILKKQKRKKTQTSKIYQKFVSTVNWSVKHYLFSDEVMGQSLKGSRESIKDNSNGQKCRQRSCLQSGQAGLAKATGPENTHTH